MKAWSKDWCCPQCGATAGKPTYTTEPGNLRSDTKHLYATCQECGYWEQVGPAAKAALDALLEGEEWVYPDAYHRVRPDGDAAQWQESSGEWGDSDPHMLWVRAYRKGREVALAEQDAKVTELVEAVLDMTSSETNFLEGTITSISGDWPHLRKLAKALKS